MTTEKETPNWLLRLKVLGLIFVDRILKLIFEIVFLLIFLLNLIPMALSPRYVKSKAHTFFKSLGDFITKQ